jgi:predicted Zn-dependent peptidase
VKTRNLIALAALLAASCGGKKAAQTGPDGDTAGPASAAQPTAPAAPASIIAASKLPATVAAPISGDPLGATIHRLQNGLTVYISTDRTRPRVSAWIAVRAGSRQDPADSTGLAHYLEHMLFKGSSSLGTTDIEAERAHLSKIARLYDELRSAGGEARRAEILAAIDTETQKSSAFAIPNEFDQLYAALGIRGVNAFTSTDETVYIADVPSNRFDAWVRVEGDRFADPQFRLFYPELEAVYEEKNRSLDSPSSRLFQAIGKALFPTHPYGTQPTIGLVSHLKTPAYGDMVEYFERWYVPNNMAVILAGDIDAARALPALEKAFGGLSPKPLPESLPGTIEPIRGRKLVEVVAEGENAVYLSWQMPAYTHDDRAALEVMDLLLDNSTSGLLNVDLVLPQKLPRAGSFLWMMTEAGQFSVYGTARAGQSHDEVERLLLAVIARLEQGEITQADIDAVVVNAEIQLKESLESNGARVRAMAEAFINRESWDREVAALARMRAVTPADVKRVAARLGRDYVVARRVAGKFTPPRIDKPKITAVKLDTTKKSTFAESVAAMPATELSPEWLVEGEHYRKLAGPGGDVIAVTNDKSDLFAVSYSWEIGSRRDRLLCFALDAVETAGTDKLDAVALKKKLYAMGTSITFGCGPDGVTASISGIDRNLEASVALLRDWLGKPAIDATTLGKLVDNTVSRRADALAEPRFVARALASYADVGSDAPSLLEPGTKQLEALKNKRGPADLARRAASLLGLRHRTGYFGPRPAGPALVKLLALGDRLRKTPAVPALRYRKVRRPTIYFVDKTAAQAQVSITFPHAPLADARVPVARLYSEYVGGGMGALIFQEIREARGLAYSAWAGYATGDDKRDQSSLYAGLGTQADKTGEALAAILELLGNLGELEARRFAVARESLVTRYQSARPEPRAIAGQVFGWMDLGLDRDPRPRYLAAFEAAAQKDLATFAVPLAKGPPIIAITGPADRIDLKALGKIGQIVEVKPEALVSW